MWRADRRSSYVLLGKKWLATDLLERICIGASQWRKAGADAAREVRVMTRWICTGLVTILCAASAVGAVVETAAAGSASAEATGGVAQIALDGPIGPAAADDFEPAASRVAAEG